MEYFPYLGIIPYFCLMQKEDPYNAGRGAQVNVYNRFDSQNHELRDDFLNYCAAEGEEPLNTQTVLIDTFPKTIINMAYFPNLGNIPYFCFYAERRSV